MFMSDNMPEWFEKYYLSKDKDGYVDFNLDRRLGQNQYVSRYVKGRLGEPNLGEGLNWKYENISDYHFIKIHVDDLVEFHDRVEKHKESSRFA